MVLGFDNPFAPPTGSFPLPVVPPDVDSDESPLVTVCFNAAWLPVIMGALQQLTLQATWQGDADAVLLAQSRAQLLLSNFASTTGGCFEGVCFDGILYDPDTDTVKQTFDGGSTYVDAPYADPRHSLSFQKPPLTTDAQCQAAANAVQNIKGFIDQLLLIIDDAGDALGLVGLIVDIISIFIPIGIFFDIILDLAALMFGLTGTVINAAFTPTVYDQLLCILYCRTESDGTWTAEDLVNIEADIASQIGGTVQTVLEGMFLLTGEVGLTNMGIQGTATADCSGCECPACHQWTDNPGGDSVDATYTYHDFQASSLSPHTQFTGMKIQWHLRPNVGATLIYADIRLFFNGSSTASYSQVITTQDGEVDWVITNGPVTGYDILIRSHYSTGSNYPQLPLIRFEYLDAGQSWIGGEDCP